MVSFRVKPVWKPDGLEREIELLPRRRRPIVQLVLMSLASSLVWAASLAAMVPTVMLGRDSSLQLRSSKMPLRVLPKCIPQLRVPNQPPKKRVPQTISEGRRLVKIESLMDIAELMKELKFEEARAGGGTLGPKGKRKLRLTKWAQRTPQDDHEGAYGQITEYGGQIARWLPDVFSESRVWKDPLVADDLAMLFDAFSSDLEQELMPVVVYGLKKALETASLHQTAIVLEAMATARHTYDEAYKVVGELGSLQCLDAPEDEVAEFGFALALASQRISKQCYLRLKEGMQSLRSIPGIRVRLLAWAVSEAGTELPDILGKPPGEVEPDLAEHIWSTCSTLASSPGNRIISGWPLPIVEVQNVLPDMQSLINLANSNDLWRPSARRGGIGEDAGKPMEGFPWTALLSSPSHRSDPSALAFRQWVANSFQAPLAHVEAVRLIRYRQGEAPKMARSDARAATDNSLWLSGQRLVTVMLQLNEISLQDGGETFFPNLQEGEGMKIPAVGGSALLWPTVDRNGNPTDLTDRMALPLSTDTVKYVALTWLRVGPAPGEEGGAPA